MFKVKDKILVELDIPTISGLTYPKEVAIDMIKKITDQRIYGVMVDVEEPLEEVYQQLIKDKETFCWIENARVIVDETEEPALLLLICDVVFDDDKMPKETVEKLNKVNWRLNIVGSGEVDENKIVKNYDLMYFNIENVDELYYNNKEGE